MSIEESRLGTTVSAARRFGGSGSGGVRSGFGLPHKLVSSPSSSSSSSPLNLSTLPLRVSCDPRFMKHDPDLTLTLFLVTLPSLHHSKHSPHAAHRHIKTPRTFSYPLAPPSFDPITTPASRGKRRKRQSPRPPFITLNHPQLIHNTPQTYNTTQPERNV